jgi:hypothetical protein
VILLLYVFSSVLLEVTDCLHFDIVKVPACDRVVVYGFSFGAGERFLLSPEPLVSAIPLLEVIKSITRDIPSYYFVLMSCKV